MFHKDFLNFSLFKCALSQEAKKKKKKKKKSGVTAGGDGVGHP